SVDRRCRPWLVAVSRFRCWPFHFSTLHGCLCWNSTLHRDLLRGRLRLISPLLRRPPPGPLLGLRWPACRLPPRGLCLLGRGPSFALGRRDPRAAFPAYAMLP